MLITLLITCYLSTFSVYILSNQVENYLNKKNNCPKPVIPVISEQLLFIFSSLPQFPQKQEMPPGSCTQCLPRSVWQAYRIKAFQQ